MGLNILVRTRIKSYFRDLSQALENEWDMLAQSGLEKRLSRVILPILVCGAAGAAVTMLQRFPYAACIALIALMVVKHRAFPIRLEWAGFVVVSLAGAYAESQIIMGSGAWRYAETQIGVIPVWLAPLWGLVGMCLITSYDALTQSGRETSY